MKSNKQPTGPHVVKQVFPVLEMSCAACAVSVESMLKSVKGVKQASVNYANQTALVELDLHQATVGDLQKAVQSIGYDLLTGVPDDQVAIAESGTSFYRAIKLRTVWSAVLTLPVVVIGMFFMDMPNENFISMVLALPVVFILGRRFFINAWKHAMHGRANMDTLVALSTGIAFFFSVFNTFFPAFWHGRGIHAHVYYEAAAVIITPRCKRATSETSG